MSKLQGLRDSIKEAIHVIEPGAGIVLYGSRVRGDARPDSDWDLLILVDGALDPKREDEILDRLYDVELSFEEVLSPVVFSRQDWESPRYRAMPFWQNVEREGVAL